jgi:hypothetical protein
MLGRSGTGASARALFLFTFKDASISDGLLGSVRWQSRPYQCQAVTGSFHILSALRKRNGGIVAGEGAPARWCLASKK